MLTSEVDLALKAMVQRKGNTVDLVIFVCVHFRTLFIL